MRRRVPIVIAVLAVLAFVGAWAALRDAARRLDAGDRPVPVQDLDPQLTSSFVSGPALGDLHGLQTQASESTPAPTDAPQASSSGGGSDGGSSGGRVVSGERVSSSTHVEGSSGFTSTQSGTSTGRSSGSGGESSGAEDDHRGGSSPDGNQICNMPAMC